MDSFDDDYRRDYENDDPSEAPPQHQVQPQWQAKAEPVVFTSKTLEERGCVRKSLVILYVLVGASLLVSTAALVLIRQKWAELARDLKRLQSDQAMLKVEVATRSICPACWLPNAGNCYYFSTVHQNWSYAKQACKDQGAQLIIIENQQEQEFLTKNSKGKNYWIGLNDIDKEGTFKWIDHSSVSYRNWDQGEPNDDHNREDCVHILKNGKWNDAPCGMNQDGWICEKKWTC
ncbi:C-type lectin domain family 4 member G-like [Emydura macquarii macquarii]|uniref:C-type lectin domain family 4 member G-like n=1 Tax=Emydura macquarii macquarii TaxID=1129001 RepID=UPI00352AF0A8